MLKNKRVCCLKIRMRYKVFKDIKSLTFFVKLSLQNNLKQERINHIPVLCKMVYSSIDSNKTQKQK